MNTNKIQKSTSCEYKQHIHYPVSLYVPVYVSWSIFVCTCVCILEYLLSKRRDICEVAREVIRDVATDITDVHREHCHKERNQVYHKFSSFNWLTRNTIRFSVHQLSTWWITWIMEDWDRSLLTGLSPGKGCGELFVLLLNQMLISIDICRIIQSQVKYLPPAAGQISRGGRLQACWTASVEASTTALRNGGKKE